jgi:hypothetical protein
MSLSPSQRVTLMKEVAARLASEQWAMIDLTLSQFGLKTTDTFSGNSNAYILTMIQSAPDRSLIDLAQHLGFAFEHTVSSHIEPAFWRKGMFRVFISHLAANRKWAGDLQEALLTYGISGFVAHNDIEPTTEWQKQIETALSTCDALIALLHNKFHESKWTDQEIGFAMGRAVPVFSVHFDEAPYGFIERFQAFNGVKNKPNDLAGQLFEAYRKNKQTKEKMSSVLVELFEQSGSFAEARTRIGYLEGLDVWEPSFSSRIQLATESNSQVSDAFYVKGRAKALIEKWAKLGL